MTTSRIPADTTFERTSFRNLLDAWRTGGEEDLAPLNQRIFRELRKLAGHAMRFERTDHTLQPTALVNEAFLELIQATRLEPQSKTHFFGIAANLMRQILIQHARRRTSLKRGGDAIKVTLEKGSPENHALETKLEFSERKDIARLDLQREIETLKRLDPRQAKIVEMRLFADLKVQEIAQQLEISPATVKREWATAKIWLYRRLQRAR